MQLDVIKHYALSKVLWSLIVKKSSLVPKKMSAKKSKDTKPLSPFAFNSVLDDYRRTFLPKGRTLTEFITCRGIQRDRFYPVFLTVYKEKLIDCLKGTETQSPKEDNSQPVDEETFFRSLIIVPFMDKADSKAAEAMQLLESISQKILEKEYNHQELEKARLRKEEIERVIKQQEELSREQDELRADIENFLEEQKLHQAEVERLKELHSQGKLEGEELMAMVRKSEEYDNKREELRQHSASLTRRVRSLRKLQSVYRLNISN